MSALGLAIAVPAPMGATPAAKRGEVAATSDFAAILDATGDNDAAPAPVALRAEAEAAPVDTPPANDDVASSESSPETPVAATPIIVPPVILIAATPPVAIEADTATTASASTDAPLPVSTPSVVEAEAPVAPSEEAPVAAPSVAKPVAPPAAPAPLSAETSRPVDRKTAKTEAPTAEARSADTLSDEAAPTTEPAAGPVPAPKTETPAARTAAPASAALAAAMAALLAPPARTSGAVASVEAPASAEAAPQEPALGGDAPPPPRPTATANATEPPRTRDVIERAPTRANPTVATEAQGAPVAKADTASLAGAPTAATPAAATATTPPSASTIAPPPAPVSTDIDAVAAPVGQAAQPTAERPLEVAAPPSAPSASRASIETTVHIAAQIVRKLEGRSSRFEMALTPEGLGNVDVSLDIDADGKLIAKLAFDNPVAATEMRGRVDELRRQLQESGFTVADDALSFTERDPSAAGQGGAFDRRPDPRNARAFGAASRLEADADRLTAPARWIPLTLTPDRVDLKV